MFIANYQTFDFKILVFFSPCIKNFRAELI